MKSRERQASGGSAPQASAGVFVRESTNGANGHRPVRPLEQNGPLIWEDWYRSASPEQQAELLALARRQGLIYAQQIPAKTNGNGHAPVATAAVEAPELLVLKDLLAGRVDKLVAVEPPIIEVTDADLDPLQRQAVARALATPDVCLIQGGPGTGKSRVIAEILTQASVRGLRVLFLAQNAACVDALLLQLAGREGLLPIRVAGPGESIAPAIQPMLLAPRQTAFRTQVLERAIRSREDAEHQCRERQGQVDIWSEFLAILEGTQAAEEKLEAVRRQLAQASAEVERDAANILGEPYVTLVKKRDEERTQAVKLLTEIEEKIGPAEHELTRQSEALAVAESSQGARWWSPAWWLALIKGQPHARKAELKTQVQKSRDELAELRRRKADIELQEAEAEQPFQAERQRMVHEEITVRQTSLTESETGVRAELDRLDKKWTALAERLRPDKLRPQARTKQAIEDARQLWQQQRQHDEESCSLARQWVAFLQDTGERLAERLPALAGVIAATIAGWSQAGAAIPGTFDLLVIDEAEQLSESALTQLAPKARRWVLVGSYLGPSAAPSPAPANARQVRPVSTNRTSLFHRLWQLLHADLAHLPYAWRQENDRLVCQLRTLSSAERGRLELECLADSPEIELHILTMPRAEPLLAQVAFPAGTTLFQAKEFIFRELQEIPLQTAGRNAWLEEHAEHFLWRLTANSLGDAASVTLESGLYERIAGEQTVCLEFAKSHWTRARVLEWTQRRFRHRDLGRTVFLQVPHRMAESLATWVDDVLFPGTLTSLAVSRPPTPVVTFIPVTTKPEPQNGVKKQSRDLPTLEIDLTTNRGADAVPPDLLAGLPRHGYVNYREAQAIIHALETLHQSEPPACCQVIAFFPGQAELIRRLLAKSTALAGRDIAVGLPGQFTHGQCQVALLSLTRSNVQKSGIFVAEFADLIVALSRARERLILVGDPDTLLRWSQGQEPTESADPGPSKQWLRRLASYLRGQGSHQAAFHLCDGPFS